MHEIYVGIDPGMCGGIAVIARDHSMVGMIPGIDHTGVLMLKHDTWRILDTWEVPILATDQGDKLYGRVDAVKLIQWLRDVEAKFGAPISYVFIEEQGLRAYGGERNALHATTILRQDGSINGAVDAGGWISYPVHPQAWHHRAGIVGKGKAGSEKVYKANSEAAIRRLFKISDNEFRVLFQTERGRYYVDRMDAALIAWAGLRLIQGG
jgi:hypothetical protein